MLLLLYFSEEEGEKYLMLEEHQHANQHSENCVITLPDNPKSLHDIDKTKGSSGPKIVELQEENLEKTACFNGELDNPASPVTTSLHPPIGNQQLSTNTMVPEANFQGNVISPLSQASESTPIGQSLQGSQCIAPSRFGPLSQCQTVVPDQDISQSMPLANCGSSDDMGIDNSNRIGEYLMVMIMQIILPLDSLIDICIKSTT